MDFPKQESAMCPVCVRLSENSTPERVDQGYFVVALTFVPRFEFLEPFEGRAVWHDAAVLDLAHTLPPCGSWASGNCENWQTYTPLVSSMADLVAMLELSIRAGCLLAGPARSLEAIGQAPRPHHRSPCCIAGYDQRAQELLDHSQWRDSE
jgi:hypothetical protein